MARVSVGGSNGERSWKDEDKFVASFQGMRTEKIKGDDAPILSFITDKGEMVERWATTLWLRLVNGEAADKKTGRKAQDPCIKEGDILEVAALDEVKGKNGRRFRPFKVDILTGKEIPKSLR